MARIEKRLGNPMLIISLALVLVMSGCPADNPSTDADVTAPEVPTGLVVTAVSSGKINLVWNDSTDDVGVAGYRIYRGGAYLKTVASGTSTSDTGLSASTQYCYCVSAYDAEDNESALCAQQCATTHSNDGDGNGSGGLGNPLFTGFDFQLAEGDFWEYGWDYSHSSYAMGSGSESLTDSGTFRVTLGPAKRISGVDSFAVTVEGKSRAFSDESLHTDFAPRWRYIAVADHCIYGSENGTTLVTLFDAQRGSWPGSGFFDIFSSSKLVTASPSTIKNDYIDTSAIRAGISTSEQKCEYFPGIGTICGSDTSSSLAIYEYFKEGLGPIGYYYQNSYDSTGGGFYSGATWTHYVGLVASSLRGDAMGPGLGANEMEPNDSSASAQEIEAGYLVKGDIKDTDTSESFSFMYGSTRIDVEAEDWYSFSLSNSRQIRIELHFPDSTISDLDLFLFQYRFVQPLMTLELVAYSIDDNISDGDPRELITYTVSAGKSIIAVDAFDTKGNRVDYTLYLE